MHPSPTRHLTVLVHLRNQTRPLGECRTGPIRQKLFCSGLCLALTTRSRIFTSHRLVLLKGKEPLRRAVCFSSPTSEQRPSGTGVSGLITIHGNRKTWVGGCQPAPVSSRHWHCQSPQRAPALIRVLPRSQFGPSLPPSPRLRHPSQPFLLRYGFSKARIPSAQLICRAPRTNGVFPREDRHFLTERLPGKTPYKK